MGEKLSFPGIPQWMADEVSHYDLPLAASPRSVLDIGANIGAFTLLALKRWPSATIIAYEPVHSNADEFRKNCATEINSGKVDLNSFAVRDFTGLDQIFVGDRGVTCSFHQIGRQTSVKSDVRCVDAASIQSCEFVKIDTEGCEVEILGRLNLSETKVLCIEYHRKDDVALLKHIAGLHDLKLHQEKPFGDTWGLLVFAREGAIVAATPTSPARKVFIALPIYQSLDVYFTQSLIKLLNEPPCNMALRMNPGDSLVSRARNTLTADFLESDCTHLLFIDTDLVFGADQIERIMEHDEDIVGGFYPKKQEGEVQWVCNGCLNDTQPREDGLQEVRYMGTGFLRVSRRVFERMIEVYGDQLRFKPDHRDRTEYDFWSVGTYQYPDGGRRYLSEDWYFCQRALDLGIKVWGDTRIVLKHVGQAVYPLQSQQNQIFARPSSDGGSDRSADGVIAPIAAGRTLEHEQPTR